MSNRTLVEITGSSQATVEMVTGNPPVVEVSAPVTPAAIEIYAPGPQGPTGLTGVVSAAAPLLYDPINRTLSITLKTALVDASTPSTIYTGQAPSGSTPSVSSWTITRTTYNAAGVRQSKGTATGVTWTGRAGHIYS